MARLVIITFAIVSATAASPYAPRQSPPKAQLPQQPPPQQPSQYQYQQPLPRPLTEVLSSNMLLQMADLVGGRPSAMPPTLAEDSGRPSPFNSLAARQAIAMTDSQQVGVRGKADDNVQLNTNKNTACARAIVVCCKPNSEQVRYGCFEALGCPGFFIDVNPCSKTIVSQLVH